MDLYSIDYKENNFQHEEIICSCRTVYYADEETMTNKSFKRLSKNCKLHWKDYAVKISQKYKHSLPDHEWYSGVLKFGCYPEPCQRQKAMERFVERIRKIDDTFNWIWVMHFEKWRPHLHFMSTNDRNIIENEQVTYIWKNIMKPYLKVDYKPKDVYFKKCKTPEAWLKYMFGVLESEPRKTAPWAGYDGKCCFRSPNL